MFDTSVNTQNAVARCVAVSRKRATANEAQNKKKDGGAEGIRTPDPHNAIVVLYQLSYDPIRRRGNLPGLPFVAQA
jgi:hypothetical protein